MMKDRLGKGVRRTSPFPRSKDWFAAKTIMMKAFEHASLDLNGWMRCFLPAIDGEGKGNPTSMMFIFLFDENKVHRCNSDVE